MKIELRISIFTVIVRFDDRNKVYVCKNLLKISLITEMSNFK